MSTKPQGKQEPAGENLKLQQIRDVIGQKVLQTLGQPGDLYQIQVRPLWDGYYRVNVLTGTDGVSIRFAHSYFLKATDDGSILTSTPELAKQY